MLVPGFARADLLGPYAVPMGAGDAWSVAHASSGIALDRGLIGGFGNPAAFVTDRNEIYGEGSAWGAFAVQNRVSPSGISYGAGSIGYLTSYESSSLVLLYRNRSQLDRGAGYGNTDVVDNQNLSDVGIAYAFHLKDGLTAGVFAGAITGSGYSGILQQSTDLDTIFTPHLWFARFGIQDRVGTWRYAFVLETPAIGSYKVDRPVNIARKRAGDVYSYRGPWTLQAGLGRDGGNGNGYEMEISLANSGTIVRGDDAIAEKDISFSAAISGHIQVSPKIRLASGLNYRLIDPADHPALLLGLGGDYSLTEKVTLFGGAGIYFPTSSNSSSTALDDVRPWIIRGGIMFFERD